MRNLIVACYAICLFSLSLLTSCDEKNQSDNSKADSVNINSSTTNSTSNNKPADPDPSGLYIIYSYDTNGKLETCGCSTRQQGGLARRGTIIDNYRANNKQMLMLDGGKILSDTSEFSTFKAEIVIKMMSLMDYTAMNVGCYEAAFDLDVLYEWAKQAAFPFISSNILIESDKQSLILEDKLDNVGSINPTKKLKANDFYSKVTGQPSVKKLSWLASPVVFISKGDFRIGILGVSDPVWMKSIAGKNKSYVVLPVRDSLKNLIVSFADQADLWIVLVESEDETIKEAMKAIPEIKIWLSGNPRRGESSVRNVQTETGQFWQNIFRDGKYVGISSVLLQNGDFFISQNEVSVEDTIKERSDLVAVMNSEYRPKLEKIFHKQNQPIGREFVYAVQCQKCHTEAFQNYMKSSHVKALDTLTNKGQNWNPDCVACHIEFDELNDNQVPMQCTACHYRVWDGHIEDAESNAVGVKPLNEEIGVEYCVKCHNPENSTEFAANYEEYFAKIKHWKGPTVPVKAESEVSTDIR